MTEKPPETVLEFLQYATRLFKDHRIDDARLEAELLLSHALGCDRVGLYVRFDQPLTAEERTRFGGLLRTRGRRVPVQYILGYKDFWTFRVSVEPGVLIPRSDTECMIEEILALHRGRGTQPRVIGDVGTGSGCIAMALASEFPEARVFAGDIADKPLEVAARNVAKEKLEARVSVVRADGLAGLRAHAPGPFDLVATNPPYITELAMGSLPREIRDHEPTLALVAGPDGLDVIRGICKDAAEPGVIAPGGALFIEIGEPQQVEPVRRLLLEAGFESTGVRNDYAHLPRVVYGLDHA
jgi:release factor glutamine methyltransferase